MNVATLTPPAPTAARIRSNGDSSHWYHADGRPCYEIQKVTGPGTRPTTLADARKLNLLPSVTTILKVLHKQALVEWLCEQAVLAAMTSPRLPGEADDAFIERVLRKERQQDQESAKARELGTDIHNAMERLLDGGMIDPELHGWCLPAYKAIAERGSVLAIEKCLVGAGYAGKTDLIQETDEAIWLWDWKTAKKLPTKGAWSEHRLQLAAYAAACPWRHKPVRTGNVYISTLNMGQFVIAEHEPWEPVFELGFKPLVTHWQWANNYIPERASERLGKETTK